VGGVNRKRMTHIKIDGGGMNFFMSIPEARKGLSGIDIIEHVRGKLAAYRLQHEIHDFFYEIDNEIYSPEKMFRAWFQIPPSHVRLFSSPFC
jgi:hypothetical protein